MPLALLLALLAGVFVAVVRQPGSRERVEMGATKSGIRAGASSGGIAPDSELTNEASSPTPGGLTPRPWQSLREALAAPQSALDLSPAELDARKQAALDEVLVAIDALPGLSRAEGDRLARYAGQLATSATPRVQCWSQDTPPEIVQAYLMAEQKIAAASSFGVQALQGTRRWSRTATDGTSQSAQGLPVTLTWSIVPDGTPITASDSGDTSDPSNLRARMAAIYGGSAAGDPATQPWFPVFQAVFDNLAAISGLRFIYEPNDDGVTIDGSSSSSDWGSAGIRGDIRISGHAIDGNSNTLAYAYYPDNGDVVIDTNDNYIATISNNSIRLRNIMEHEIGHSLGLAHVCPVNQTKLMEPFINLGFRGCQFDDIYSTQRRYGDPLEVHDGVRNNDTTANATPLALTGGTQASWQWLSIDDNGDTDFYSFPATDTQQVTVRIIPSDPILPADPVTDTYLDGAQNSDGTCTAGTAFDPTTQQDLILDLLAANGTTVLASAPVQGAGLTEQITNFRFATNGTHLIRVRGGSNDRAQLYRMEVLLEVAPPTPEMTVTSLRLDAESNSGANGVPDPGETLRLGITLTNGGDLAASALTATLSAPADSTVFDATASFGTLAPGESGEGLFTVALAGVAGQVINLQLTVNATGYSAVLPLSVTLGAGISGGALEEHFDASSSLPAGWTQSVSGAGSPWVVSSNRSNSAPNSMFSPSVTSNGEALLMAPSVTVGPGGGLLEFSHRYLLELSRDGGVVEASRNGGAFFDLLNSDATVQAGDYSGSIVSNSSSAIRGREAWTGSAASFITTRVKLPAAWAGESIVFRWRLVHNSSTIVTGWNVDDVKFWSLAVSDPFRPHLSLTASGESLSEASPSSTVMLVLSTPLPLVQDETVTLEVSGAASSGDVGGPISLTLPAGETSVTAEVGAVLDSLVEGPESLVLSLPPADLNFVAMEPSSVAIEIADAVVETAILQLSGLLAYYDGTAKSATVVIQPGGVEFSVTYNGSTTLPVNAGSYAVVVTVTRPGYIGSASGTLVIVSAYTAWIETFVDPQDPLAAASADLDGDGWDNAGEYTFGANPNDPTSLPLLQPVVTPGTMQLLIPPAPLGMSRFVETSTDLETWTQDGVTEIPGGYEVPRSEIPRFLRVVYEVVN
ncbi:MBG domain-containing protein [Luteolibacter arcticus]|uniref:MBG domain-containing protein n=1 Tax=Luteolibacter arcticus TaxID=1581411 RepID=A0ABT3GN04_9BACT|nr:MBG domain-containing protein [Luteolibacter arcticus]MCW1924901.1 MBG domain-containing protein [Luteolibacter arcticus]